MLSVNPTPSFNITRASHVALTSRDLAKARDFYTEVIGLKVSDETATTIHFRSVEERGHHSLTLRSTKKRPECEWIGFRVSNEDEVDKAKAYLDENGIKTRFVNVPFQGRTLRVEDTTGMPIELCARMQTFERSSARTHDQKGAGAQRLNYFQVLVPDVADASAFYGNAGFRVSDYACVGERIVAASLHRKDDPHDLVMQEGPGPRLHHFGYVVQDASAMTRALDAALHLGFARAFEHGPVRHGHSYRLYLRDPDEHRIALLLPPIQMIDADDGLYRHDVEHAQAWSMSSVLYQHATAFANVAGRLPPDERTRRFDIKPSGPGLREDGRAYVSEAAMVGAAEVRAAEPVS